MCQKRLEWLDLKEKNRNRFIIRYKFKFKKMYAAETIKKIFRICHFSRNVDMNKTCDSFSHFKLCLQSL